MEHEIDGWIEQLTQCKQLTEADVKKLCDKVHHSNHSLPVIHRIDLLILTFPDERDPDGRVQCPARKMSSDRLW